MKGQKKIAITTDSNSGFLPDEARPLDVFVLPMPFIIDGETYFENINLSQEQFYEFLEKDCDFSTSQPAVGDLTDFWDKILQEFDEIVHIPMSSGLSNSCQTAITFAKEYDGRVQVVDNHRISVLLKSSVYDAIKLRERGFDAVEIKNQLESIGCDASIYIAVGTMKYLKKGGRVTPGAAAISTLLRIKPVLKCSGEKFGKHTMVHNIKKAKEAMIEAIKNDLETKYAKFVENGEILLGVASSYNIQEREEFVAQVKETFPELSIGYVENLTLSVACHIGPGALGVAAYRIIK